jgi:hypothetical protein
LTAYSNLLLNFGVQVGCSFDTKSLLYSKGKIIHKSRSHKNYNVPANRNQNSDLILVSQ